MKAFTFQAVILAVLLSGCSTKGDSLGADVYDANGLNTRQEISHIEILDILPAKVAVDNRDNKKLAQVAGGVIGAVAGAVVGYNISGHSSTGGGLAGGALGGALGTVGGNMVDDKTISDGVTLTYKKDGKTYSSTQLGKACEFKRGRATMVEVDFKTRIQPNSACSR